MPDEPRLEQGESGEWVKYLQESLEHQGYPCGAADGEFGDTVADVVRRFQDDKGLSGDGVVDEQTWDALVRGILPEDVEVTDERMAAFDVSQYPLLAEMAQYGEGDEAVRQFLVGRGLDDRLVDTLRAGI